MNDDSPPPAVNDALPQHAPADNLGAIQPHRKPRKAAKVVLAGLMTAAGISTGAAILTTNTGCPGVPAQRNIATQPSHLNAAEQRLAGDIITTQIRGDTEKDK